MLHSGSSFGLTESLHCGSNREIALVRGVFSWSSFCSELNSEVALNCEFFAHVENFPHMPKQSSLDPHRSHSGYLRSSLICAATGMSIFQSDIVRLTSLSPEHILTPDKATSTLQIQDSIRLLELQKAIRFGHDSDMWYDDSCYETWFTARVLRNLWKFIAAFRFLMRLTSPIVSSEQRRSLTTGDGSSFRCGLPQEERHIATVLELLFNVLSFYTFRAYKHRLQVVWSDKIITLKEWDTFLRSLLSDWQDSNLLVNA